MSLAQALTVYLNLNLLIVVGFAGLSLFSILAKKFKFRLSALLELKLHYTVILSILFLTAVQPLLPGNDFIEPAAKVWSAQSIKTFSQDYVVVENGGYLSLAMPLKTPLLEAKNVTITWIIFFAALLILGILFMIRDLKVIFKIKRNSFISKKIGCIRIFVNEAIEVPFSYWLPGQANIVIPMTLLGRPQDYRISVAHELQHHRQGDTRWVYVMWFLRLVNVFNPVIYFWNRWISELQEFACDETLVDQHKVDSQAYARCLVEVAQSAINQKRAPVCATGLTFMVERNLLKRRIEKMLFKSSLSKVERSISITAGLLIGTVMAATAVAAKGLVQDRRISMDQAQAMAARAQGESEFKVVVNVLVLKQLNRFLGTPEGREYMKESLARMENHKSVIGESLQKYGVPVEIMAIPIIESGYKNLPEIRHKKNINSAGLWQFIRSTARNFGLKVNDRKDERLDVALSTDAAARYLQANHLRFKDWHLSLLAYNVGEKAVQKGIEALDSRDAWTLIRKGYEGDKDYLPKLMAAVLIMRNPEVVD